MSFNLPLGLSLGRGANRGANLCITEGTDGTWYGYMYNAFGTANPNVTTDGTLLFSNRWAADGTIIMSFGNVGDTQLTDVAVILVTYQGSGIVLTWDEATLDYRTVNTTITDELIADYELDKERCYTASILPDMFIHYDFAELKTGVA